MRFSGRFSELADWLVIQSLYAILALHCSTRLRYSQHCRSKNDKTGFHLVSDLDHATAALASSKQRLLSRPIHPLFKRAGIGMTNTSVYVLVSQDQRQNDRLTCKRLRQQVRKRPLLIVS